MKAILKKSLNELAEAVENQDWSDRYTYGCFLAQTFFYSRHTTRLLALAGSRFPFEQDNVHRRFMKHVHEEMSHEVLADRDLKALGLKLADFHELPVTQAFYQTQYYLIEHENPWAFFGFILVLEGLAVGKGSWLYEQVKANFGESAGNFLKVHAKEDIDHLQEAERTLEQIDPKALPGVISSLELACYLYRQMLIECGRVKGLKLKAG